MRNGIYSPTPARAPQPNGKVNAMSPSGPRGPLKSRPKMEAAARLARVNPYAPVTAPALAAPKGKAKGPKGKPATTKKKRKPMSY